MNKQFLCALLTFIFAVSAVPLSASEEYDPRHTLLALNMASISINRILSTQDRIVLDQEYENIMNNLSLGNIKSDSDILELYRKILDIISRKRISDEESEMIQKRYDKEMKKNFIDKISAFAGSFEVSSGNLLNAGSNILAGNVFGLLGDIGRGCMSGYFLYQDNSEKMRYDLDQASWRLKAADLNDINELQKQLLTSSWILLNQYKLPENERLVENVINEFYQALTTHENSRRLRMLRELEKDFKAYPPYWFYRAKAARETGEAEEGRKCLDKFDEIWRPVLRQDPYIVEACKFRISDLIMSGKNVEEIHDEAVKYLDLAKLHTPRKNWADNLFIGTLYFVLGEKEKGISAVRINEDFGHEKQITPVILRQMQAGKIDIIEISTELEVFMGSDEIIPLNLLTKVSGDVSRITSLKTAKNAFMTLYASEWSERSMSNLLNKTINFSLNRHKESLSWYESAFAIDTAEVQEKIFLDFKMYSFFLRDFQNKYYSELMTDLRKNGAKGFQNSYRREFFSRINKASEAEESDSGWLGWIIKPFIFIFKIILFIIKWIAIIFSFIFIVIANLCLMAWNFFTGSDPVEKAREILINENQAFYTQELPNLYWSEIEPYIKENIKSLSN